MILRIQAINVATVFKILAEWCSNNSGYTVPEHLYEPLQYKFSRETGYDSSISNQRNGGQYYFQL